ncbi:ATP-binding cassette domain-containing protein [Actinobacteria bacterium YIM 96077]|uniref:Cobalt ABC transporter ATP-binding protein n=1 Tax=Phytoactinopolyspora halophila TaxID=1981511 RepID=A0A329QFY2_9ACTN|nr:ATP-binding cassette domain-containing protein [Phytoactinopolyspora halophila]AYY13691.1 ATP-binding cassette domain-containing protein [Actinobacteria bacterium YIM 96077]RAW11254.1 cobalt ABC transporter ATP-binding protein [Phytoactinopolyspora halophila]
MIIFDRVSVQYDGAATPVLRDVDVHVAEGELCLVVGQTGTGKSTLLRTVNGLVPHFTGGTVTGRVLVDGRDTREHRPRDLADVVGFVGQDPRAGVVAEIVEDELAFGMEWLGLPPDVMRRRVEETLDLLGLADVRRRAITTLSGGQRQRVAIGAALIAHPRILVLDEPTSALDPQAAEDVLAALHRLVHDLGTTVLLAEHRLERVVQYADHIVHLPGSGSAVAGEPAAIMETAPVAPPVVELGRLAGWSPLPLSVRDARRAAAPLRERLVELEPARVPHVASAAADDVWRARPRSRGRATPVHATVDDGPAPPHAPARPAHGTRSRLAGGARSRLARLLRRRTRHAAGSLPGDETLCSISELAVQYGETVALRDVSLDVRAGEIVAVMGRNGAGKSSLLAAAVGMVTPAAGQIRTGGIDPRNNDPATVIRVAGLVPQDPADLLYADSTGAECLTADRDAGVPEGSCRALLHELAPDITDGRHPRDLSEGQRLALALAVVLVARPPLVLLDEPTRGLDYAAKQRLAIIIRRLAADGHAVVLATHDVELVAELATRVVVVADGELVADGPTADVVVGSPVFAPQVAKILAPQSWLTVSEVEAALHSPSAPTP